MLMKKCRAFYKMKLERRILGGLRLISQKTMVCGKMNRTKDSAFPNKQRVDHVACLFSGNRSASFVT
jgi:hypothetical protein